MKLTTKLKSVFSLVKSLPFALVGLFSSDNTLVCKKGFAVDKFLPSVVTLFAKKQDDGFVDLSIEVSTGCETVEIKPPCTSGKNPIIELFSFDKTQPDMIFFSVEPTENQCYAAVFSVKNCQIQTLFDSQDFVENTGFEAKIPTRKATTAAKSNVQTQVTKQPAEGNFGAVAAVFPYYNFLNQAFSLQVWMQNENFDEKNQQLSFANLKLCDGQFQKVFEGVANSH